MNGNIPQLVQELVVNFGSEETERRLRHMLVSRDSESESESEISDQDTYKRQRHFTGDNLS